VAGPASWEVIRIAATAAAAATNTATARRTIRTRASLKVEDADTAKD
jgi:hypothetical protein